MFTNIFVHLNVQQILWFIIWCKAQQVDGSGQPKPYYAGCTYPTSVYNLCAASSNLFTASVGHICMHVHTYREEGHTKEVMSRLNHRDWFTYSWVNEMTRKQIMAT